MYGAILGDIIGSPYEFDRGNKTKDFPLFNDESEFTDDTVMTIAVAEGLMNGGDKMYVLGKTGQYETKLSEAMSFTDKLDAIIYVEKHGYERFATIRQVRQ